MEKLSKTGDLLYLLYFPTTENRVQLCVFSAPDAQGAYILRL